MSVFPRVCAWFVADAVGPIEQPLDPDSCACHHDCAGRYHCRMERLPYVKVHQVQEGAWKDGSVMDVSALLYDSQDAHCFCRSSLSWSSL